MKATAWLDMSVEVDVSIDQIIEELGELNSDPCKRSTLSLLSECVGFIKEIPDAQIRLLNEDQRRLIADAMRTQADRYAAQADEEEGGVAMDKEAKGKKRWVCPQCFTSIRRSIRAYTLKPEEPCRDHFTLPWVQISFDAAPSDDAVSKCSTCRQDQTTCDYAKGMETVYACVAYETIENGS